MTTAFDLPLDTHTRALVDTLQQHLRNERGDLLTAAHIHLRSIAPLMSQTTQHAVASRAVSGISGLGALDHYLARTDVREVMVNAGTDVYIEDSTGVHLVDALPVGEVDAIIERILLPLGKRLDRSSPIVDARLADGSRVCAVIAPIAVDGSCLSIRRFSVRPISLNDFGGDATVALLTQLVHRHCNVLVTGAASTGKTTLLNALCAHIPAHERVITVEDTAELQLQASHVVRLEARPPTAEGVAGISISELLRTALRMRPDRFVVGEVRGGEVVDMLAAMNTGHHGSFATCHANSADDALLRLESLMLQHCGQWPREAIAQHICAAIDVVISVGRHADGSRSVIEINEISTTPGASCRPLLRQDISGGVPSELRIGQLTRGRS